MKNVLENICIYCFTFGAPLGALGAQNIDIRNGRQYATVRQYPIKMAKNCITNWNEYAL